MSEILGIKSNQGKFSKVRIFGRETEAEEARKFFVKQIIDGLQVADLARTHNVARFTIYRYLSWAQSLGEITKQDGKWVIDLVAKSQKEFQEWNESHKITEHPLVQEWQTDLLTRKDGGPIKNHHSHIMYLERFCNYLRINPQQLVIDKKTVEQYLKSFSLLLRAGKTGHNPKEFNQDGTPKYDHILKEYKNAIRSFVSFHGISLPKGIAGVLSNKVLGHGKYADIKLSDEELHKANEYIISHWGLQSDIYRLFWVGVESCARAKALLTMKLEWIESVGQDGITTFEMIAYESKTKHIKDGKWTKYIRRAQTQQSLRLLKCRQNQELIYLTPSWHAMYQKFTAALKEIYRHLGKVNEYYYKHSVHALRHIGAHYWLRKTNYNYGVVAMIGGWHTIDELKKSYGEMPSDILFDVVAKASQGLNQL